MKKTVSLGVALFASAVASAGVHNVKLDTSLDRVKTPLRIDFERIGTIRPRAAGEIRGQNWRLGCETLDRDYINFEEYKEFIAPLGIKLVRLQGGWTKCERVKGRYDFAWLDRIVDYLKTQGVTCAIETDYGNALYKGGGTQDLGAGFPTSEEGLAAWDKWVDALTKHFKGRVRTFMMWNEPDIRLGATSEQIAAFNVRTAKIVRANVPDAEIAGLSLASSSPERFEACLKAMGSDIKLFDSFVYHGYQPAPETSYANVETNKLVLARYHPTAKLWQGENGCPSEMREKFALNHIAWSEYSQAKWDMRRMLGDLGHDVFSSIFTICDFYHMGKGLSNGMNPKGLLRANEEKEVIAVKRAYYAVQNVVSVFDDTFVRVKGSSFEKGFGAEDTTLSTYHYVKETGEPLFVFWTHGKEAQFVWPMAELWMRSPDASLTQAVIEGSHTKPKGRWESSYDRPGDSFETRPAMFKYTGGPALKDPVWVDLLTGRVYAYPKANQLVSAKSIRFVDVPVYDSPCVLTERSAISIDVK